MRIGFDIDGVLANFPPAYEKLFVDITGDNNFPPLTSEGPGSWNWPTDLHGYTAEHTKEAWRRIKKSPDFWVSLDAILPDFIHFMNWLGEHEDDHELYFVTARPGTETKWQTEQWFINRIGVAPTVLISEEKGMIAKALNLDLYVDDKAENIKDVEEKSPNTKAYLIDRGYNRHISTKHRIANLEEFLNIVQSIQTTAVA